MIVNKIVDIMSSLCVLSECNCVCTKTTLNKLYRAIRKQETTVNKLYRAIRKQENAHLGDGVPSGQ